MRPDRIILGEVRSSEAIEMLQAMGTGHDGSMATLHANAPRDALERLEMLIGLHGFSTDLQAVRPHTDTTLRFPSDLRAVCTTI